MQLLLFDINENMCREWGAAFYSQMKDVEIVHKDFDTLRRQHSFDGLVSPANSFGIMDGGIDLYIRDAFPDVQKNVTYMVFHSWQGFMPVGAASIVKTGDDKHPWLVVAPTMEWPRRIVPITVYNVMRSLLREVNYVNSSHHHCSIHTLAISGLGTATGHVPTNVVANLMALAWSHHNSPKGCSDWEKASLIANEIENAIKI